MDNRALALAKSRIYDLPQIEHIPESRIERFFSRIVHLKEDPLFHVNRLFGIGGSEVGALLRHQFGYFYDAPGDSFKTAYQVIAEKLIKELPSRSSIQANRGTDIEPLTRAVVRKRFSPVVLDDAFEACRAHKLIKPMLGNIDEALGINKKRVLLDYKSSQEPYPEIPFDYQAQINHYAAIGKSNGYEFDSAAIVGIHAPEPVLQGLAKISRERESNPAAFNMWVDIIARDAMPGLSLKIYNVKLNPQLQKVIEHTVNSLWSGTVEQGKLLVRDMGGRLCEERQEEIDLLMGHSAHLMALQESIDAKIAKNNSQINDILMGVDVSSLTVGDNHIIDISSRTSLDQESALRALEAEGVSREDVGVVGDSIDANKLRKAFIALGGDINNPALREKKITAQSIRARLMEADLPVENFETSKHAFAKPRKKAKKAGFEEEVKFYSDTVDSMIKHASLYRPSVDYDDEDEQIISTTMTM